ncbi:putative mg2+ co2+ transporter protein [Botrytis cinerea BcDW1]|uniref:Putative mg2+ co2+ transporter protein n=1 Tax=Botryotinia fuckeliana (strain BcDW1) TaxID=1290391 RepID=M7TYX7_BOTF1|nr:putative mg2+ co2+ transporter protein [Botrytis cinerea BcDW1]
MESGEIPLVTLIADISLVQGSEAKSISYQKFNWQPQDSNPSCVDYPDSVNFVPMPSLFNEQLAIIPSETSTRALFLILPPIRTRALDRSVKTAPRRSGPKIRASDRLLELATLSSDVDTTTSELLETRYNTNIEFGLSSSVSDTMAPGASQLGFDFGRSRPTRPRPDLRWIINDSGNFKTGSEDSWSLENESQDLRDANLTSAWIQSRGVIEGFELITQKLEDYQEGTLGIHENDKIQPVIDRHRKRLQRARELEQYVRDTLQCNVGRVSLMESRKSIQQSNTLGRLSVLAFIFLPISLVTWFFGMNISELTGSGAS